MQTKKTRIRKFNFFVGVKKTWKTYYGRDLIYYNNNDIY